VKINIQSLESIKNNLEWLMSTNSNRSLSGIFKSLRKQRRIDLIGDYPLLSCILDYGYSRSPKYVWNRNKILRAVRISKFYQDEGRKHAYIPDEWERYIKDADER